MEMHLNKYLLEIARPHPADSRRMASAEKPAEANDLTGKHADAVTDLTRRQLQVLALLAKGKPNKTIANVLGIAEGTVKIHLTAIFKALRVQNRSQAAVAAVTAALRPDAPETMTRGSPRGSPGRHPFDNTGRARRVSLLFPGPVLRTARDADF